MGITGTGSPFLPLLDHYGDFCQASGRHGRHALSPDKLKLYDGTLFGGNRMWAALSSLISAIPSAATSPYALVAYALAAAVYALSVWRVSRNKNLLANLQKLPPKDRRKALEREMGSNLAPKISAEQWVRSRIHRYYFFAFLATCAALVTIVALALFARTDPPGTGAVFIGNVNYVAQQYQQINNNQILATELKQQIQEGIELATRREFARAQEAFMRVPDSARVPAVWNDLGVVYEGLGDLDRARSAYATALRQQPDFPPAQANLARLQAKPSSDPAKAGADSRTASTPPRAVVNLLAPDQGGHPEIMPGEDWRKITSGKEEDKISVRAGAEAEVVYAFKDNKPATFATFEMLIAQTDMFNPKEIEILAADNSRGGPFRSVGKCTMVNAVVADSRYQRCDLPETTARYVKIKLISTYHFNQWANLPQIRLIGRLEP